MQDDTSGPYRRGGRSYYATLVPFPIACFVCTLLTDLAYIATDSFLWETFSVWLLTLGLVTAGIAIMAGLVDLLRSRRVRGLGQPWLSVLGQFIAFALALIDVFVHSRDGYTAVVPQGVLLSALVVLVLAVTFVLSRPTPAYRTEGLV